MCRILRKGRRSKQVIDNSTTSKTLRPFPKRKEERAHFISKWVHKFQFHSHFNNKLIPVYNAIGYKEIFKTTELVHIYDKFCAHLLTYHQDRRGTLFKYPNR